MTTTSSPMSAKTSHARAQGIPMKSAAPSYTERKLPEVA